MGKFFAALGTFLAGAALLFLIQNFFTIDLLVLDNSDSLISMSYADWIAIILTALGVILAALAIMIGILAIWGAKQIQSAAEKRAHIAATAIIEKSLQDPNGLLNRQVREAFGKKGPLYEELKKDVFAGMATWDSSGFNDPIEESGEQ